MADSGAVTHKRNLKDAADPGNKKVKDNEMPLKWIKNYLYLPNTPFLYFHVVYQLLWLQ